MFENLVGNHAVKEILARLVKLQRVPNSLLFVGEEGVGKRQFALEIAKSYLCINQQNYSACGNCQVCLRIPKFHFPKHDDRDEYKKLVKSEHADVRMAIPYNRNILVDAIREIEREANYRPFEGKFRFLIVDEADKMNAGASNALLKTLEEPPETAFIFLITSRPDALLQTIRSRCQIIRFAPVAAEEIENLLASSKDLSKADAKLVSKLARGSVSRALDIDLEKFRASRLQMLSALKNLLPKGDRAALLITAEKISDAKLKDEFEPQFEVLQTLIYDVWTLKLGKDSNDLVNADITNELQSIAHHVTSLQLSSWLKDIEAMREDLKFNLNRKITSDALFMQMAGL